MVGALIIISSLILITLLPKKIEVRPGPESIILPTVSYPMNQWLDKLQEHENCPSEGIIDSNGKRSYGLFCFQAATFARYSKIFGLPTVPIYDPIAQRDLTILILETYPEGWSNWLRSVSEIGKPPV